VLIYLKHNSYHGVVVFKWNSQRYSDVAGLSQAGTSFRAFFEHSQLTVVADNKEQENVLIAVQKKPKVPRYSEKVHFDTARVNFEIPNDVQRFFC